MICLFNNKATKEEILTTNGDYILDNICSKSVIGEKTNVDYSCQFIFEVDKQYSDMLNAISNDAVIRVDDEEGEEPFRIVNVIKNKKTIEVFAVHITIRDTINMWCEDVRPTNQSGQGALTWIFDNAIGGNDFNVTSNISNINTAYYESMSVYNALYGADNSFINRWGGETRRRGYNITINDKIGSDRGMQIASAKNLEGFESKTNLDQLCTVLYVKGFDGIKLDTPVVSPLLNNYSKPYYKEIKFDDIKVKSENNPNEGYETLAEAQAEMLRRGQEQFSKYHIDTIQATYNINFVQLEKTEEYKKYSIIETAFMGDTVEVIEDTYNINIKVRVTERKYDVLKQERIETVLSNLDLKTKQVKVEDILKQIEKSASAEGKADLSTYIDAMLKSGIKDSYVIHKQNETLYMDTKDINTATNVTRINKKGLGFSQNGYYGKYTYGFTIDGKINASLISVGVLNADLIKSGILESFNGLTYINMEDGTFNFANKMIFDGTDLNIEGAFQTTFMGEKSISIASDKVDFYGAYTETGKKFSALQIGTLISSIPANNRSSLDWNFWFNSIFDVTFWDELGVGRSYFTMNPNKEDKISFGPVVNFMDGISANKIISSTETLNFLFASVGKWVANKDFHVNGNSTVTGSKNCVQKTVNYGERLFYSVEDGQSFLTETSQGNLTVANTVDGTYERVVLINNIYKECVDLENHYIIEINKTSWGDYRIKEQTKDYFILESDREDFTFNYCIKAKRKGYESVSLEEYVTIEEGEVKNETIIN